MKRHLLALALLLHPLAAMAEPSLDFLESFARPETRAEALRQLVPGSEDHYFYHALHAQLEGRGEDFAKLLVDYQKRYNRNQGVRVLENRQALLRYEQAPQATLDYLRRELSPHFGHQREVPDEASTAPNRLDPALIDGEKLLAQRLREHPNGLSGITDEALRALPGQALTKNQRRELLNRLDRADFAGLLDLVVADLQEQDSGGFGSVKIHAKLFASQLDALAERLPAVRQNEGWVNARLVRLRPDDDTDFRHDRAARRAWLTRARTFADGLDPKFNTLKACLLHEWLQLERAEGRYDKAAFLELIKLPRPSGFVRKDLREKAPPATLVGPLDGRFQAAGLPPWRISDDLINDHLRHFLARAEGWQEFLPYFEEWHLKETFATAHLLAGTGDAERLASLIDPAKLRALRERVDIDFLPVNPERFGTEDEVVLQMAVKHVPELLVKVYEINALNVCRETGENPRLDLDLDGLVATREFKLAFAEPPLRRVERTLSFPELKGAGVWVVELIGNGRSSRALVRKGRLIILPEIGPSGHEFRVLDEARQVLPAARLHFGGRMYTPGEGGVIAIPFSTAAAEVKAVAEHGALAEVFTFGHQAEQIDFHAGLHVDREQLLAGETATALARPVLTVNGRPVGLKDLEEARLILEVENDRGVTTREEVRLAALPEDAEVAHPFRVPERAVRVTLRLTARIQPLAANEKQDLESSASFAVNTLRRRDQTEALNLTRVEHRYALDLRGLNGEARAGRPVNVRLRHRWLDREIETTLSTDAQGRIELGLLPGITRIAATSPGGQTYDWPTLVDQATLPDRLFATAGGALAVALPAQAEPALLALRAGRALEDLSARLVRKGSVLWLNGLEPGDYELLLRPLNHVVQVRVGRGVEVAGHLVGANTVHRLADAVPVALGEPKVEGEELVIPVENSTPATRVHLAAARFLPAHDAFAALAFNPFPTVGGFPLAPLGNQYSSGRAIGDEVRYVLDRQSGERFAGVLLPRPGLLLNPWERQDTSAERESLAVGEAITAQAAGMGRAGGADTRLFRREGKAARKAAAEAGGDFLDFLAQPAVVVPNLRPQQGAVRVKLADLRGLPVVTAVAVDLRGGMARTFSGGEAAPAWRDLRLARALPAEPALTEMKRVTPLRAGESLRLDAAQDTDAQVIDHLGQAITYYQSLRHDADLDRFRPLAGWAEMNEAAKLAFYGPHACHELHFFLYHKDRPFFDRVVRPYLAHKRDKTFLDLWLLDADLTAFTEPRRFDRLHAAEQALLARRLPARAAMTARLLDDRVSLVPPDRTEMDWFFDTGLSLRGLQEGGEQLAFFADLNASVDPFGGEVPKPAEEMAARRENRALAKSGQGGMVADGAAIYALGAIPAPSAAPMSPPPPARPASGTDKQKEGFKSDATVMVEKLENQLRDRLAEAPNLRQRKALAKVDSLYRKPDATKEWAENNYWQRKPAEQEASLVSPNRFWVDFARADPAQPFLSAHFPEAGGSFSETLLALAVLDLPFAPPAAPGWKREGEHLVYTAAAPALVFHQEIRPAAAPAAERQPVVIAQLYFDHQDRTRELDGQTVDKYLTEGFVRGRIYGGRVIVTNPTGLPRKLDVLTQIPEGAIPVQNGFRTREFPVDVEPFASERIEYLFYFPRAGEYACFPAVAAEQDALAARAEAFRFTVLEKPAGEDPTSWDYVSQRGDGESVLRYLRERNLQRVDLGRIAWRLNDRAFFTRVLDTLRDRQVYHDTLWSYGVKHNDSSAIREWLARQSFAEQCGDWFLSALLRFEPVERLTYEHLEYAPLVNPRAHPVGGKRTVLNEALRGQYSRLLKILGHKPALDAEDRLALTYYLLLQDRLAEALVQLAQVPEAEVAEKLQLAYLRGWAALAQGDPAAARAALAPHAAHPVPRWRALFAEALAQLDEIQGVAAPAPAAGAEAPAVDRESNDPHAAAAPTLEIRAERAGVTVSHRALKSFTVNYYPMDIEVLFSKRPFLQEVGGSFSFIRPVRSEEVVLPDAGPGEVDIPLPAEFKGRNLTVEVVSGGLRKTAPLFAGELKVELIETFGQVRVTDPAGKPLPRAYVKVYGRQGNGEPAFYKDGYTDLRGRFDYASLNSDDLDAVNRFAILVLDPAHGAVIREAEPPRR
jgi:hypothetical protein